jgi:hypothetical protein
VNETWKTKAKQEKVEKKIITRNGKDIRRHFAVPSVIHLLTQPG